jgi:large subunit ribosomal protein L23
MSHKSITLRPRLSEKTYSLSESRVYVVEVPKGVNKHSVARAMEEQFEGVKVSRVNLTNIPGKAKRVYSISGKRVKNAVGRRNDIRKAYVTLKEGSLPFFAAVEEEEQKEQKLQEQVDKAASKQAAKEDKKPRRGLRRAKKTEESK